MYKVITSPFAVNCAVSCDLEVNCTISESFLGFWYIFNLNVSLVVGNYAYCLFTGIIGVFHVVTILI